jgi:pimeloyl-ACP methyl ester carboxylesterase/DNA-binding winged helix-turn-helix (wHTH) protein
MAGGVYTFGPFRLEVDERRLLRDGQMVPLVGKAFDTLVALVEGAGTLQKQRALLERLWSGVVVDPNNLQHSVSVVRRALGSAPGVTLQTVRGQGYRLIAEVRRSELRGGVRSSLAATSAFGAQRGYFCKAADGARLAYAKVGSGAPIVKAAHGLGHLELDRGSPLWAPWIRLLSQTQCLVRYDLRGHGLSGWEPPSLSFEAFVSDLGAVFDAAGIERAPVLGISHGAAVAAAYAARYPDRVSGLVLIGGCARGWRAKGDAALIERFSALMVLMRQGCGAMHAEFRQLISAVYFPQAPPHHINWFSELQRQTTTPANAAHLLSSVGDVNIGHELPAVRAPTLVLHSRDDMVVPMTDGIELASGIPRARFVPLESKNHVLHAEEPAWQRMTSEVTSFLAGIRA